MSSGVIVDPSCLEVFQMQKIRKKHRYILYNLSEDYQNVVLYKSSSADATYEEFLADIPDSECMYATVDLPGPKGQSSKLIFIMYTPQAASVKDRMVFASSKDGFVKKLEGVHGKLLQASEKSDLSFDSLVREYF
ncbi:cofilin actin-depolymerizing factor 1 protein [Cryptosporidium andersoni]|uniref:Cofilin actin-depolymerizing factor 1 protein n=1 Tax=Cryptosporidium andersoni TaxID=117008 RepID=A0A1J4MVT5_9CRYT|nr:cofilin actin-depolymerizing factor 1 protein [Cryptosporidium andersoni]